MRWRTLLLIGAVVFVVSVAVVAVVSSFVARNDDELIAGIVVDGLVVGGVLLGILGFLVATTPTRSSSRSVSA